MKKMFKLIMMTIATTGVFWGAINVTTRPTQVLAAKHAKKVKWRKGTPKELRGNYETKKYGADLMFIGLKPSRFGFGGSGMPVQDGHNVYYRSLGHHRYIIRCDMPRNGGFRGAKNAKTEITKIGKMLKVAGDSRALLYPVLPVH